MEKKMAKPKLLASIVQLYAGVDLIGSTMSVNNRKAELEVTPIGVKMKSKKTKRSILIPWSNVKGIELLPEADEELNKET
jgi:hypothetical protein